jgi:hypothetical protein
MIMKVMKAMVVREVFSRKNISADSEISVRNTNIYI